MSRTRKPLGSVALVGAGPGDPGLLTLRAIELLAEAEVVVADLGITPEVLAQVPVGVPVTVPAPDATPATTGKELVALVREGRRVVRLTSGDPFLLGGAALEAEVVAKAKLAFEVVPGVSGATAIPTYAGVPPTGRSGTGLTVATLGSDGQDADLDWRGLAAGPGSLVLLLKAGALGKAATRLVEHGRRGDTPVSVTRHGTTARQRTVVSTLDDVETDAGVAGDSSTGEVVARGSGAAFDPTAEDQVVMVVGDAVRLRERLSWFESRPLFGWTVLVPRTRAQAGPLSARLRAYGATPVEVPTIAVEPPRSPAPMERAVKGLVSGRYMWVVFTSTNAVKAVREKFEEFGLDARAFAGISVAAVGEATADAVRAFGIRPDLVPTGEQSSDGLLAEWAPYDDVLDPIDRVLLPRADIATETLVAGLKERGWAVDDVTAYRTVRAAPPPVATRDALKGGGFDAVVFTSSSTVRNLVGIAGKPHDRTVLAAIGPQTAETVRELGLRLDVQAAEASAESLADSLAAFAMEQRAAAIGDQSEGAAASSPRPRPTRARGLAR